MLKDIELPKPLLEFIESAKQRFLAEPGTKRVERVVELVWTDMIWPSYTNITLHVFGSGEMDWIDRCVNLQFELDDAKPDSLFDCVPGPYLSIECCRVSH